jgi:cytochrome c oxidase subunit 1
LILTFTITYFVVAHFHLVMGISALYGCLLVFITGSLECLEECLIKFRLCSLLGYCNMCLWCVFSNALYRISRLPRRYYTKQTFLFDDLQNVNVLITTFALVGGAFQRYFTSSSIFYGKKSL